MARNGSGTYNRAVAAYVAGTTITAATVNSEMDDIATALTGSMARDGQSPATANIPMGGFRLTGLANAIANTDAAALGQVAALAGATMTGALGVTAGTAAAPGVFVSGDTNTGLFQPSADTLAVTVGGAEVARFGANGLQSAAPWVDLASATTTDLGAQTSTNLRITGTTTITGFGTIASGTVRNLRFADALTLTHNGTSLQTPGLANITTAAGDTATAVSLGSGNWVVTAFQRAANAPLVVSATGVSLITAADAAAARAAAGVGIMAVVTRAATQSIPNVTDTAISWDNVQVNDSSIYAGGSPTRLTVPAGVTRVRVTLSTFWAANNTGTRNARIRLNNSTDIVYDIRPSQNETGAVLSRTYAVVSGDYFEAFVSHNAGGALNIGGNNATAFSMEVLR